PPADPDDPRVARAAQEWDLDEEGVWRITTPITAVTDGSYKLVRQGEVERLFDLAADPLEERPLPADADPTGALRRALADPVVWEVEAPPPPTADEIDDDTANLERQMRLLGYL
ncbi:MAG TPA: hypothetical protein VGR12_06330, partial [Solirubrobacteraceae bacterium]|nr:hypothetical protein [Solirubrobacteraceae bacterium]